LGYYAQKLSAERLRRCYEIAPPRVQQYLRAEIEFVMDRIGAADSVLELGCGYGRVLQRLLAKARLVVGVDTSRASLLLAKELVGGTRVCHLVEMNAVALGFRSGQFEAVICIQNGISAFKVDPRKLMAEAIRVTQSGGTVLFSSYSERFWEDRLEWFRIQADYGLVGEIDDQATGEGTVVCKDGFRATTFSPEELVSLASAFDVVARITEVNGSSIFCELEVK